MAPKNSHGLACFPHFFDPVPQVMFLKVPWLTLAPFWLPFGSLLVSFWFRLDRFGYPFLIHFELLTVRFFFIFFSCHYLWAYRQLFVSDLVAWPSIATLLIPLWLPLKPFRIFCHPSVGVIDSVCSSNYSTSTGTSSWPSAVPTQ